MLAHLTTLREEHKTLVTTRTALEDAYCVFAIEECDMEEDFAKGKIAKARSAPQKNKRLQSIHEAHKQVLLKEAEITEVEGELAAVREAQSSGETNPAPLNVKKQQDEDKVINKQYSFWRTALLLGMPHYAGSEYARASDHPPRRTQDLGDHANCIGGCLLRLCN